MTNESEILHNHPRAESLINREKIIKYLKTGVVARAGLIAHGRGETFDYLIGEKTWDFSVKAIKAAAATILLAENPVISVNGNVAALSAKDIVNFAGITNSRIEINLFYRTLEREIAIKKLLEKNGAKEILGICESSVKISEINSQRRRVDPKGILIADVVFVPLEDGDRTEALQKMGKKVIAIDLNPLSRTAQMASITIVDNVVRALPRLINEAKILKKIKKEELIKIISNFNNKIILTKAIDAINQYLTKIARKGKYPPEILNEN